MWGLMFECFVFVVFDVIVMYLGLMNCGVEIDL